ncbi:MAG: hypothetical protein ABSF34_16945 [Verrucomicrobiota bacterium]
MALSRIAQLATSPLLKDFAAGAGQNAVRKVGNFIAPLCMVPDLTFRYKVYTEQNRYRMPNTNRQPGSAATQIGFSASDATIILQPNALDFPIAYAEQLSDEGLSYAIQEGQTVLADSSALVMEYNILTAAQAAAIASPLSQAVDFTSSSVDPVAIIDAAILSVMKASKNGAPVKILFGATKFQQFRNNPNVRGRIIVSNQGVAQGAAQSPDANVGTASVDICSAGGLFITNPECELSTMVIDESAPGLAANIQFLLDEIVIIFAANSKPNRFDPSFMKTFAVMGGWFKPGNYTSLDGRDGVLKMDWAALPTVTNAAAVAAIQ